MRPVRFLTYPPGTYKLFEQWDMSWRLNEAHLFDSGDGCAILWEATLKRMGADRQAIINGMDLVLVQGELISRNEARLCHSHRSLSRYMASGS